MNDVPEAKQRIRWWPGLIWAVPIAVFCVVAWLGIRAFASRGPEVAVIFPHAGGVLAGDTKVKYDGMNVGQVEDVSIAADLSKVTLTLRLDPIMQGHLGAGTRFWIAGESFSLSDPAALKAIISGPYVGVDPAGGEETHRFTGLTEPPILKGNPAGLTLHLHTRKLGTVQRGTPIYFRDVKVGSVTNAALDPKTREMQVEAFIDARDQGLANHNTRFWNASAVQLSTAGGGASVQFQSVPALFAGAIVFDDFGRPGPAARSGDAFALFANEEAAKAAPEPDEVDYRLVFPEPAGGLAAGDRVTLMDAPIGYVRNVSLEYDPSGKTLATRAAVALQTGRIHLAGGRPWASDPKPQLNAMLRDLIGRGLRAELGRSVPLVGAGEVKLVMVPSPAPASLGDGDVPEIPSIGASGVQGAIASADNVIRKIDAMPLPQIANDIHQSTERLAQLTQAPELTDSLRRLDRSIANVEKATDSASTQIGPVLAQVRRTADQAQVALRSAQDLLQSGTSGPEAAGLPDTLYELSRAARALRELSDYLDRHPGAVITGKGSNG